MRLFIAINLPKEVKDFLYDNLEKIISNNYIIFEAESDALKSKKVSADKFFNFIANSAVCYKTSLSAPAPSFDDFKKSIRQNNIAQAIYVLAKLYEARSSDGEKKALGLQLLGILISEFSYLKNDILRKKYFSLLDWSPAVGRYSKRESQHQQIEQSTPKDRWECRQTVRA